MRCLALFLLLAPFASVVGQTDPDTKTTLRSARELLLSRDFDKAQNLCTQVLKADPKNIEALALRAQTFVGARKPLDAVADFTRLIELEPMNANAVDARGGEYFKAGKIAESVADFDRFLAVRPVEANGHWRRGISLYYAGKFEAGRDQFRGYEKVDTNDVENAVWHFLCNARLIGVEKARGEVLKIGKDGRVPMMEVYALFQGKARPEDVLAAATAGNPPAARRDVQLFYAHLYLGLHAEVTGDAKKTREHLTEAAKLRIAHYMGDVAVVHLGLLPKP